MLPSRVCHAIVVGDERFELGAQFQRCRQMDRVQAAEQDRRKVGCPLEKEARQADELELGEDELGSDDRLLTPTPSRATKLYYA